MAKSNWNSRIIGTLVLTSCCGWGWVGLSLIGSEGPPPADPMIWAILTSTKKSRGEDVLLECYFRSGITEYFYLTSRDVPKQEFFGSSSLKDTDTAPLSAQKFEELFKPGARLQFGSEYPTIQIEVSQKPPVGSIWIQWDGNRPLTYHFDDVRLYLGELAK